jgi:adenylate kinase
MVLIGVFRKNIALLGAPGSGKGSYGRLLAKRWGLELVTVSDVLRKTRPHLMQQQAQSGTLLDDQTVSDALLEHLSQRRYNHEVRQASNNNDHSKNGSTDATHAPNILVDGFPRTLQQVQLMEQQWPPELQISLAIHLDVPVDVCQQKLLGRRYCTKCGGNYNTSHVQYGNFHLPPTLPPQFVSRNNDSRGNTTRRDGDACCDPTIHWSIRSDDTLDVVQQRLQLHTQHMPPIVQHYESKRSVFHFQPYKGWADVDRFHHSLEQWLLEWHSLTQQEKQQQQHDKVQPDVAALQ